MDKTILVFLEGVFPYFKMLEKINEDFLRLLKDHQKNTTYENTELLYSIATELTRLVPAQYSAPKDEEYLYKLKKIENDGLLLLKQYIPFLLDDYKQLLSNNMCANELRNIKIIRNKYEHEPHNMRFICSVGDKYMFTIGMEYKDDTLIVGTSILIQIIYKLNEIFDKIKELYRNSLGEEDAELKEYPCYTTICNMPLQDFNKEYKNYSWE